MTESDLLLVEGYGDGRDLNSPRPGPNRHPLYIHGWRCGRDDAECAAGLRKFPSRTAQEARDDGMTISRVMVETETGKRVARYAIG